MRFPDDYRYFLLDGSDVVSGTLEPAVITPDAGYLSLVEVAHSAWAAGVPRDLVPFCEDDGGLLLHREGWARHALVARRDVFRGMAGFGDLDPGGLDWGGMN